MPSQRLFKAQQTQTIESSTIVPLFFFEANSYCNIAVADKICKFCLTAPMILSTWICTFASLRVASMSPADS